MAVPAKGSGTLQGWRRVTALEDAATHAPPRVARTATADGTGTGTIATGKLKHFISVTSANANHIIVLPSPVPGTEVWLEVGPNGCELRSSAPATVGINGGTGAAAESAIPADTVVHLICVSPTAWIGQQFTDAGIASAVEAAA